MRCADCELVGTETFARAVAHRGGHVVRRAVGRHQDDERAVPGPAGHRAGSRGERQPDVAVRRLRGDARRAQPTSVHRAVAGRQGEPAGEVVGVDVAVGGGGRDRPGQVPQRQVAVPGVGPDLYAGRHHQAHLAGAADADLERAGRRDPQHVAVLPGPHGRAAERPVVAALHGDRRAGGRAGDVDRLEPGVERQGPDAGEGAVRLPGPAGQQARDGQRAPAHQQQRQQHGEHLRGRAQSRLRASPARRAVGCRQQCRVGRHGALLLSRPASAARPAPGGGRCSAGRQAELGEDAADVLLDRALADDQLGGDAGVGPALGHQPQHLRARAGSARPAGRRAGCAPAAARPPRGRAPCRPRRPGARASTNSVTSATRSLSR